MNLKTFADIDHPLHASKLPALLRCGWREALMHLSLIQDTSSAAADTGSAAHAAVDFWNCGGQKDAVAAETAMRERLADYPLADLDAAARAFRAYADDARNQEKVVLSETPIEFAIPPHESDPTGLPVYVQGTADQVRQVNGMYVLVDLKNGKRLQGGDMLVEHCLQLAAYQYGVSQRLGQPVHLAKICRLQDYLKRTPGPVFYEAEWRWSEVPLLLSAVTHAVACVRAGRAYPSPSDECRWCPSGGLSNCLCLLRRNLSLTKGV